MPREMIHTVQTPDIPEILAIGQLRFFHAYEPMPEEVHEDAFELLFVHSGRKQMAVDGVPYSLGGGDLLVIAPDEPHGEESHIQTRATLYYLILANPAHAPSFCGMEAAERLQITQMLMALPEKKQALSLEGQRIMRALQAPMEGPLSHARQRAALTALLIEVVRPKREETQYPEDIWRAVEYIAGTPEEIPSVGMLAALVNLSESRFKQKFKRTMGVPPAEYIAREKIARAKDRLRGSEDRITEIAMSLGFTSSQHFSILFKRYTGLSPKEYRSQGDDAQ